MLTMMAEKSVLDGQEMTGGLSVSSQYKAILNAKPGPVLFSRRAYNGKGVEERNMSYTWKCFCANGGGWLRRVVSQKKTCIGVKR